MGFALVSQNAAMQIAALVDVQGFVSRSVLSGGAGGRRGNRAVCWRFLPRRPALPSHRSERILLRKALRMILGAVLAGGLSSRFGSDKALAEIDGHTLIALAVDALSGWCEHVIVVGRELAPAPTLPDWPHAGMGPLGGLAAALHHAVDEGYEAVLSCGVDAGLLPDDLLSMLSPAPACIAAQPVIGLWPASAAVTLDALLQGDGRYSMNRFADLVGARRIDTAMQIPNINTPADLLALPAKKPGPPL